MFDFLRQVIMRSNFLDNNAQTISIRLSSLYMIAQKLITPVLAFFMGIYIVRHLSLDDYGTYSLLLAMMMYIGLFSSLGLPNIFKRFIPQWQHQGEQGNLIHLIKNGLLARAGLILLLSLMTLIFSSTLTTFFHIEINTKLFAFFAFGILFFLEAQLMGLVLTSLFLHRYFALAQVLYALVRTALVYTLIEAGWQLKGLLIGEVLGYAILVAAQIFFFNRCYYAERRHLKPNNFPFKRIKKYAGYAYFNEMGEQILDVSTDIMIISIFLGPAMAALYAFATSTIKFIARWMPHRLLIDVITPAFYRRFSEGEDPADLQWMFTVILKMVFFFFVPFCIVILINGDALIRFVYDPKYLDALRVMQIVVVFRLFNAVNMPMGLVVQALEKVEIHFHSKIFSVYNLLGNLLVVGRYGIIGVALVTSTAVLFKNIFTYIKIRKHIALTVPGTAILKILFNAGLTALLLMVMHPQVTGVSSFVISCLVGAAFYLGLSIIIKPFSARERETINKIIGKNLFLF